MIHDLTGDCCQENIPGFESTLYIVEACNIVTFPAVPAYDESDPGASVIITDDIELKPNTKFKTIPILLDSGSLVSTAQGNTGSKGFRNDAVFDIPGSSAVKLSFAQQSLNGCFVAILVDKQGKKRLVGSMLTSARFDTIEITNNNEDSKTAYLLYDTIGRVAPIYEGVIDLDETT